MAKNPKAEMFEPTEHCPGFWKINNVSGCPAHCSTCFLDFTTGRVNGGKKIISIATMDKTVGAVERWFQKIGEMPAVLNTGETGDSFAFPGTDAINEELVKRFEGRKQSILFLTKSSNRAMLTMPLTETAIYSFSVNPDAAAHAFNAPIVDIGLLHDLQKSPRRRIRLRLDPLIPIKDWSRYYVEYLQKLATEVFVDHAPEMITLGTLRLTDGNYRLRRSQGNPLLQYVKRSEQGGQHPWRVPEALRQEMYALLLFVIRQSFGHVRVGLCKETKALRQEMGVREGDCNCMV